MSSPLSSGFESSAREREHRMIHVQLDHKPGMSLRIPYPQLINGISGGLLFGISSSGISASLYRGRSHRGSGRPTYTASKHDLRDWGYRAWSTSMKSLDGIRSSAYEREPGVNPSRKGLEPETTGEEKHKNNPERKLNQQNDD
jgi:hypothetical protein